MSDYHIIITDAGAVLETAAHAAGEPLVLTEFAVCDGAFTPDPAMTSLNGEAYRGEISSLSVSPDEPSVLVAQCIIPASSGGYTIRGIGLYAGDTLYAVGNYPDQPKPAPDSGYAASLEILAQLAVSDTADITLNVTDGAWLTKEEGDQLYVPLARQVNGHALKGNITLTAADVKAIPDGGNLGTINIDTLTGTKFGRYMQPATVNATIANGYPVQAAGALDVIQNAANGVEGCTQEYRPYNSNVCYRRFYDNKAWTGWVSELLSVGGTMSGQLINKAGGICICIEPTVANGGYYYFGRKYDGTNHFYIGQGSQNEDKIGFYNYLTKTGITLEAGGVSVGGQIMPSNWSNLDARYALVGNVYSKTASDGRYNLKNTVSVKTATRLVSKDSTTGVMEVVMSGINIAANATVNITFPAAFPNACTGVVIAYNGAGHGSDSASSQYVTSYSRTGCSIHAHNSNGVFMLIAKGY
ncbi:phage tail protein [Erwinia sp. PK3-005]